MAAILFKTQRLDDEFNGDKVDNRLKNVLRCLGCYMGGARITCLVRTPEENKTVNGASGSKHLPDPKTGKGRAADVNPPEGEKMPDAWRVKAKLFLDRNFEGVWSEIHDRGSGSHLHLDVRPRIGYTVEMLE